VELAIRPARPPGDGAESGQPCEVGLAGVLGPSPPLVDGQNQVRVNGALKGIEERLAGIPGRLSSVVQGVQAKRPDAAAEHAFTVIPSLPAHPYPRAASL
jgi:hypothetical protein